MILISHRGNIQGKNIDFENNPDYIETALKNGFNVEIDVWYENNKIYLGHDNPKYKVNEKFLENKNLWCHAKNFNAINGMLKNKKIHSFWHENDQLTLTSKNYIWVYPGIKNVIGGISVLPELNNDDVSHSIGVCSDFIINYVKFL